MAGHEQRKRMDERVRLGRAACSAQWWHYTARVENKSGVHDVFYSTTRPRIGASCPGIAGPNKILGYSRERVPNSAVDPT